MTDRPRRSPKVSVCVIAYNQEAYIRQCLQSIVDQDVDFNFEILVADDCSTDGTPDVIGEFSERHPNLIRAICRRSNIGGSKNYLDVHYAATGDYIAHLDGDDFWLPNKLKMQVEFLNLHPECSAVYSNAWVVDQLNNELGVFNGRIPSLFNQEFLLQKGNFLSHSTLMYRRALRDTILCFDSGDFIDYSIHLRSSLLGMLGYINEPLASYRVSLTGLASGSLYKVREFYWAALVEMHRLGGCKEYFREAVFDFFGSVIAISLRDFQFKHVLMWRKRIVTDVGDIANGALFFGSLRAVAKICRSVKKHVQIKLRRPIIFSAR